MPAAFPAEPSFGRAAAILSAAEDVTVLTGPGIGVGPGADLNGGADASLAARSDLESGEGSGAALRRRQWQRWLADPGWGAQPTDAHRALVDLERRGCLRAVITRNIDGLHQRAGSCPALVVELCGTMRSALCLACGDRTPMSEALARVRSGEDDPSCLTCGGALSAAVAAAGQPALGQALDQALDVARGAVVDCDAVLVAGSQLRHEVDAALVALASRSGVAVVIINPEPTPCDALAAAVVRTPVVVAVPLLAAAVRAGGRRE